MPFEEGEPLGMSWWVAIVFALAIVWGLLEILLDKLRGGDDAEGDKPYWGHHYQRRQVRKMFRERQE